AGQGLPSSSWDWRIRKLALCPPSPRQSSKDFVRCHRQRLHANTDGVSHRIGNGRRWRNGRRLTETDDAAAVIGTLHHMHDDVADVSNAAQLVELHVGIEHLANLLIVDPLFV